MTSATLRKLQAILQAHQARAPTPPRGVKPARDDDERRRKECGERLEEVVAPVLRDFTAELRAAGHEAWIQDQAESPAAYPVVALALIPRAPGALTSVLAFRCDPRRGVAVHRDVKAAAGKGRPVTASHDRAGTMRVEGVSPDWVETKTLSFVEAVLRAT